MKGTSLDGRTSFTAKFLMENLCLEGGFGTGVEDLLGNSSIVSSFLQKTPEKDGPSPLERILLLRAQVVELEQTTRLFDQEERKLSGTGGYATGAVSLMRIENAALTEIKDGGGRRAARMMCLNIDHGDIEEFLSAKLDLKQLNNANISVVFDEDPEVFFNAVRNDETWDLVWQNQTVRTVPAKDLWNKIIHNALKMGEPGILNMHLANQMNNIYYCRKLVSTNPCGEICMQPYSTCCLGAVVLPKFVKKGSRAANVRDRIDWEELHETVSTGIRFLDNVLDVTYYPTVELKNESAATRRIGLGIMGLHYFLLELGLKYSSQEGRDIVDKVMTFIKHSAYDAAIHLAIEKGVFPEYNAEKIMESGFIAGLKPSMRSKIRTCGITELCILLQLLQPEQPVWSLEPQTVSNQSQRWGIGEPGSSLTVGGSVSLSSTHYTWTVSSGDLIYLTSSPQGTLPHVNIS